MSIVGSLEQLLADSLYPYRWPVAALLLLGLCGVAAAAYRLGWHRVVWRHRLAAGLGAAFLLALALPAGYYALSPLWTRTHIQEASPLAATGIGQASEQPRARGSMTGDGDGAMVAAAMMIPNADAMAPAFAPRVTRTGAFRGADEFHVGQGDALLVETAPGQYVLRFEDFSVRNGPDLYVYLSPRADGYAEEALNLGRLRATDGSFNYELPEGVDPGRFESAIIWCRRFGVLFAVAPLDRR